MKADKRKKARTDTMVLMLLLQCVLKSSKDNNVKACALSLATATFIRETLPKQRWDEGSSSFMLLVEKILDIMKEPRRRKRRSTKGGKS